MKSGSAKAIKVRVGPTLRRTIQAKGSPAKGSPAKGSPAKGSPVRAIPTTAIPAKAILARAIRDKASLGRAIPVTTLVGPITATRSVATASSCKAPATRRRLFFAAET